MFHARERVCVFGNFIGQRDLEVLDILISFSGIIIYKKSTFAVNKSLPDRKSVV